MKEHYIIKGAILVNEGKSFDADIEIKEGIIQKIATSGTLSAQNEINAEGLWLLPGVIDDQVHFREPGLTHKAEIATESRAAVAGGVTSFMEMPNTNPLTSNYEELENKFGIAQKVSPANFSFFFGATNNNTDLVLKLNDDRVCGVKIFMGSSTGDMLVDNKQILEKIFANCDKLIATHCEDEDTVKSNMAKAKELFGEKFSITNHPHIRSREACYLSSSFAMDLAKKHGTRLHILHISTADEIALFSDASLEGKQITAEACVHHLWFSSEDYLTLGEQIQCNPAIKEKSDRDAVWKALKEGKIDIIATDHAPHTWEEKQKGYPDTPSGLPLVQHSLNMMMHKALMGELSPEWVVEKMCHAPAQCFKLKNRGYLREGYYADMVLFDPKSSYKVSKENILYKCGWSPLEGVEFKGKIKETFVNGISVFKDGALTGKLGGMALRFG